VSNALASRGNGKAVPRVTDTNFLSIHRANGDPLGLQVCVHIDVRGLGIIPLAVGKLDGISIRGLRDFDLSAASKPTHHYAFVDTFIGFCFDKFMGIADLVAPCQCESECERDIAVTCFFIGFGSTLLPYNHAGLVIMSLDWSSS
jgi:hypothetical protein